MWVEKTWVKECNGASWGNREHSRGWQETDKPVAGRDLNSGILGATIGAEGIKKRYFQICRESSPKKSNNWRNGFLIIKAVINALSAFVKLSSKCLGSTGIPRGYHYPYRAMDHQIDLPSS
ncbi:tetR-family transcriptional regulator [Striga asiatica]|uniref:TetR-family transcriptional regulator n=1 Tax=Striga asiatica TaxID=4170 RepID=A0A5A7P246_STRAF|nr:tetR-family transcriptional regulator [Striga asiatica]